MSSEALGLTLLIIAVAAGFLAGRASIKDDDLVRCETMLQWCDAVGEANAADLETATACAWYYGNCKPEGS